mgnify:CR=1 FL=1
MSEQNLWSILDEVKDPEIPVISLVDLGVVRNAVLENGNPIVTITPTYSGCPAMSVMEEDIEMRLKVAGYKSIKIETVLSPAWTTDWISQEGRNALEKYGIAPPLDADADKDALLGNKKIVKCTNCGSQNTKLVSQFGSTACKALFKCEDCQEPFDYFKCLK